MGLMTGFEQLHSTDPQAIFVDLCDFSTYGTKSPASILQEGNVDCWYLMYLVMGL